MASTSTVADLTEPQEILDEDKLKPVKTGIGPNRRFPTLCDEDENRSRKAGSHGYGGDLTSFVN
jgi:hypothetical protein